MVLELMVMVLELHLLLVVPGRMQHLPLILHKQSEVKGLLGRSRVMHAWKAVGRRSPSPDDKGDLTEAGPLPPQYYSKRRGIQFTPSQTHCSGHGMNLTDNCSQTLSHRRSRSICITP